MWQLVFFLLLWQLLYRIFNAATSGLLRFFKSSFDFFGGASADMSALEAVPSSAEGTLKYSNERISLKL